MTRKLKVLGLALVAVLAMTAVLASAAQATTTFTASESSGTVKATQTTEQVFTTEAGTVKCKTATQEGSFSSKSFTSLEVAPAYKECSAFGFLSATVTPGTCKYKFTGQASGTLATVDIVCPSGDITVTTFGCVIHVEPQTGLNHVLFSNKAGDVEATATISKVKYTATSGCPNGANGTTSDGTLTGGATVSASKGTLQVDD
jgi:hypothetical protein